MHDPVTARINYTPLKAGPRTAVETSKCLLFPLQGANKNPSPPLATNLITGGDAPCEMKSRETL